MHRPDGLLIDRLRSRTIDSGIGPSVWMVPMYVTTLIPVALLGAIVITIQIIGIVRDADWWVITRDTARGRAEQAIRSLHRHH